LHGIQASLLRIESVQTVCSTEDARQIEWTARAEIGLVEGTDDSENVL
jgi:hypothetical protein